MTDPAGSGRAPTFLLRRLVDVRPNETAAMSGCSRNTPSTSSGYTFSPPVLMHADPRPSSWIVPSASTVA